MTKKEQLTYDVFKLNKTLAESLGKLEELKSAYYDNTFNSGGADEIVDGDISDTFDFTAAELGDAITMIEQLQNFFDNTAVTTGDYGSTVNKLKYGLK